VPHQLAATASSQQGAKGTNEVDNGVSTICWGRLLDCRGLCVLAGAEGAATVCFGVATAIGTACDDKLPAWACQTSSNRCCELVDSCSCNVACKQLSFEPCDV
jgi:hypothetical protein